MKFLDLNTGYSFDGLWTENQSKGYIFWFPNEQSVNITYSMPICILTKFGDKLNLSIEENDVFSFISHTNEDTVIDGYVFNTPTYSNTITTEPEIVGDYFGHVVNIAATSKTDGEYICKIRIGDEGYIRVGADFYGEHEPAYINLSNMGVEIPETVQKAIYDSNVHEDLKDNILINRKFKELLSNYWDIVANKGSYKSLINSLEWFEWDDALQIREMWKRDEAGRMMFDDREIMAILENRLEGTFENFLKTTYVSLYYSAQTELDEYDTEYNPALAETVMRWSKNDMRLKMALLAQFFGSFFLPIHLSIMHATVEDKVFTNTIKAICGATTRRDDTIGDFNYAYSNVKDGDIFRLGNVRAHVSKNTMFGVKYGVSDLAFGVDNWTTKDKVEDMQTFANQYYVGPGVIIPIEIEIPNQTAGDFIKHIIVDYTYDSGKEARLEFFNRIYSKGKKFTIKFNFLAKQAMDYNIRFMFITGESKTITKSFNFTVEDTDNLVLNMYKVQAKDDTNGFTMNDFLDHRNYEYFFKITSKSLPNANPAFCYTQHLPYMDPSNPLYANYKGIKLNRTVVFDIQNRNGKSHPCNDYELLVIRGIMDDTFLEFPRYDENGNLAYLTFVSKYFYADLPEEMIKKKFNIIRNDLGFYPQFHNLVLMTGRKEENYTISQYEAVCCAAEINQGIYNERFRYGHMIEDAEWSFINASKPEIVHHPASVRVPFVAKEKSLIEPGYYDISFKYSLTNGVTQEYTRESAFRIKTI